MLEIVFEAAARGAALLLVALVASLGLRRSSAAARHMFWAVTVTGLLALPLISIAAPEWRVLPAFGANVVGNAPQPVTQITRDPAPAPAPEAVAAPAPSPAPAPEFVPAPPPAPAPPPVFALSTSQILTLIWLTGLLIVLAGVAFGFSRVRVIARNARPIAAGRLMEEIERIAREMGVHSVVALEGDELAMPMTWGLIQPKLLLPSTARTWPNAKLHAVLRHELAHVRRRDPAWQLAGEAACALHWFNPLAWHAVRQLRIEREHACDDEVLNAGSRASDYAAELLEIARSLKSARATSLAAIAMAQPHQLEGRLLAVLDDRRERSRIMRKWPLWVAAAAVVLPLAVLQPQARAAIVVIDPAHVSQPKTEKPTSTKAKPEIRVPTTSGTTKSASPSAARASLVSFAQPLQQPESQIQSRCFDEGVQNININSNDDHDQTVKWNTRHCKGNAKLRGKVRFNGDLSGVQSISPGGEFRLFENDGRDKREVVVVNGSNGLVYEYELNGDRRPWNAQAQAWLAGALGYLVRSTGFAAEERVEYLLRERGLAGVLAEVETMTSDYVQRVYLRHVLDKASLNATALASVLGTAARALKSDYEMAELLITIANKYEFTEPVRRAFIEAANTLESDYEHRRALAAVLKKGGLSSENVAAVLASAQSLASDYEQAELLLSVVARYKLEPGMRAAYLAATRDLGSDYEKGRVFKALLKQGTLNGAEAAEVLDALVSMRSDYERAEVLKLLPVSFEHTRVRESYLKVIGQMKSDHEVSRSLKSLIAPGLRAEGINVILEALDGIDSDYERAEVLLAVVRAYQLTPEQRNRAIRVIEKFRSDHERGRVSTVLLRQVSTSN